jgi:type IV pilus assembly protein PilV
MTIDRHRRQAGSSLIEVLIALGLVAVTMLGLLGLQLRSLGSQKESLDRRAAAVLVGGFADRVSVNFTAFRAAGYDGLAMGPGDAPPATAAVTTCSTLATCTEANVAARDWDLFRIEVRNRLPGGIAYITTDAGNTSAQITVGWSDPRRTDAASGGAGDLDANNDNVHDICALADPAFADTTYRCYTARVSP